MPSNFYFGEFNFQPLFVCYHHHLLTWCQCCQHCQHRLFFFLSFYHFTPYHENAGEQPHYRNITLQPQPCQTMPGWWRQWARGMGGLSICVSTICTFFFFLLIEYFRLPRQTVTPMPCHIITMATTTIQDMFNMSSSPSTSITTLTLQHDVHDDSTTMTTAWLLWGSRCTVYVSQAIKICFFIKFNDNLVVVKFTFRLPIWEPQWQMATNIRH